VSEVDWLEVAVDAFRIGLFERRQQSRADDRHYWFRSINEGADVLDWL